MIFSSIKWNRAEEIKRYEAVSATCSFETFEAPLRTAYNKFLLPVLGDSMSERLIGLYADTEPSLNPGSTKDEQLLFLAQCANLLLALWNSYQSLNVVVDDGGMRNMLGENSAGPYKYQENALKKYYRNSGFDALDRLFDFLVKNKDEYAEIKESHAYKQRIGGIVKNAAEFDSYYPIGSSSLIFIAMRAEMKRTEDNIVAPRLGDLYDELKEAMQSDSMSPELEELRSKLVPCVVLYAVSKSALCNAKLTDKGLYFSSIDSAGGYDIEQPADKEMMVRVSRSAKEDADNYWQKVARYVESAFGKDRCSSARIPLRSNDNHTCLFL